MSLLTVPSNNYSTPPPSVHITFSKDLYHDITRLYPKRDKRRRRISEILRHDGHTILAETEGDAAEKKNHDYNNMHGRTTPRRSSILSQDMVLWQSKLGSRYVSTGSIFSVIPEEFFSIPRVSGRTRFRRAIRKVINGRAWMSELNSHQANPRTYISPGQFPDEREFISFNLSNFRPDVHSLDSLSFRAKAILMHPSWLRTEEDVKYLNRYTTRLKCFEKYSIEVKKELARVLYYEKIEKDRIVIKQGHTGVAFYFIVSGSVLVELHHRDKTGKKVSSIVGKLTSGATFGELALMHNNNNRRRATVICNEETEFLKVDRLAYAIMLKQSHKHEWEKRIKIIKEHHLFRDIGDDEDSLYSAGEESNIKEFGRNSVIVKDLSVPCLRIHFIIQGCCKVVQKTKFWEKTLCSRSDSFIFPPVSARTQDSDIISTNPKQVNNNKSPLFRTVGNKVYQQVTKWLVIRTLKDGEYFGLGEGNENMSVICDQKVTILMVNRMFFHNRNKGYDLARLQAEAVSWYPSSKETMESFIEYMEWKKYRRNIALEILGLKREKESKDKYLLDI